MLDNELDKFYNGELHKNEDSFFEQINWDKNKVWNSIETPEATKRNYLAYAASITIFLLLMSNIYLLQQASEKQIFGLELSRNTQNQHFMWKNTTDTLYIVQKEFITIESKVVNTVYISQHDTVFINKDNNVQYVENKTIVQSQLNMPENQIFNIEQTGSTNKIDAKTKRFVFRFFHFRQKNNSNFYKKNKNSPMKIQFNLKSSPQ